jgi:transcriptional regulator
MNNDQQISEVNRKLDILLKLLAYQTVGKMTLIEGAPLLRRLGFTQSEIAAIYGTNAKVISVRLAEAKKKSKKG